MQPKNGIAYCTLYTVHCTCSLKEAPCSFICSLCQNSCFEWKKSIVFILWCVQFVWNDYYLMDFHALINNHTHSIITIYDLWRRSKRKSILRHHVLYQIHLTFRAERKSFESTQDSIAKTSRKWCTSAQRSSLNCIQFQIDFEIVLKYLLSARRCTCACDCNECAFRNRKKKNTSKECFPKQYQWTHRMHCI